MNIAVKDVLVSFVVGVIIFSLLMLVVCVGIFNSEIEVSAGEPACISETEKINLHKTVVFAVNSEENSKLSLAVFAMFDESRKELYLTPIYGDYLMNYKDSLSYVSNVYAEVGTDMLCELVKSFSGLSVSEDDVKVFEKSVINFAEFKTELSALYSVNDGMFAETFDSGTAFSDISLKVIALPIEEQKTENTHQRIQVIDVARAVDRFKSIVG